MSIRKHLALFVLLAALIVLPFGLTVITGQALDKGEPLFWQGLMVEVYIWAVFALSYDILIGYIGILSFGHALFFGTGAYVSAMLLQQAQWNLFEAILAVVAIAAIESLIIGFLSLRVRGVYFAMVTLAFASAALILVDATDFRKWTGAEDGLQGIPVPDFLNATTHRLEFYYLALAFAVAVYVLARRFVDSPSGRVWAAIRENEPRAISIGYNTVVYKVQATMVSGILASLAGMLYALWNRSVTPLTLDSSTTISALLMTIIGGAGTLIGPMLGAGILQILGYELNLWLGSIWQLVFGLIYVFLVLFFPYGIVGTWRGRNYSWRKVWNERAAKWFGTQ